MSYCGCKNTQKFSPLFKKHPYTNKSFKAGTKGLIQIRVETGQFRNLKNNCYNSCCVSLAIQLKYLKKKFNYHTLEIFLFKLGSWSSFFQMIIFFLKLLSYLTFMYKYTNTLRNSQRNKKGHHTARNKAFLNSFIKLRSENEV